MTQIKQVLASLGAIDYTDVLSGEKTITLSEGIGITSRSLNDLNAPFVRVSAGNAHITLTDLENEAVKAFIKQLLNKRLAVLEKETRPKLEVNEWASGPSLNVDGWIPEDAPGLVALLRAGRVADPLQACTAWLVARAVEYGFETGDERPAVVTLFDVILLKAGAGEFCDLQKASNDAFGFLIEVT